MSRRFLVFACAALVLFANATLGAGTYQRTRDGKTLVWNNDPKPGDEATWSGDRDGEGYARGFGTLTWFTVRQAGRSDATPQLYARYWGNMVHGKLNGPVNVHVQPTKTAHAFFTDGVRATAWTAGPASSRGAPSQSAMVARQRTEPEVPAEAPSGASRTGNPGRTGVASQTGEALAKAEVARPSPLNPPPFSRTLQPHIDIDDFLRILVWPPQALRRKPEALTGTTPQPRVPAPEPRLTKKEVVDLANAEARSRGYDPDQYQRSEPQYDAFDQIWTLVYDQKPVEGGTEIGKHFSVAVSDKTKGRALAGGR